MCYGGGGGSSSIGVAFCFSYVEEDKKCISLKHSNTWYWPYHHVMWICCIWGSGCLLAINLLLCTSQTKSHVLRFWVGIQHAGRDPQPKHVLNSTQHGSYHLPCLLLIFLDFPWHFKIAQMHHFLICLGVAIISFVHLFLILSVKV